MPRKPFKAFEGKVGGGYITSKTTQTHGGYLTAFGDPLTSSTENKNNQSLRDKFLFLYTVLTGASSVRTGGLGNFRGVFATLTVPLPPVLKIYAAIRLTANIGFIFQIPYESGLSTGYEKIKPPPGGGGSVCFNVEIRGVEPLTS